MPTLNKTWYLVTGDFAGLQKDYATNQTVLITEDDGYVIAAVHVDTFHNSETRGYFCNLYREKKRVKVEVRFVAEDEEEDDN